MSYASVCFHRYFCKNNECIRGSFLYKIQKSKCLLCKMQTDKFSQEVTLVQNGLNCSLLFFTNFAGNLTDKKCSKICVFTVSDACAKAKKNIYLGKTVRHQHKLKAIPFLHRFQCENGRKTKIIFKLLEGTVNCEKQKDNYKHNYSNAPS